MTLEIKLAYDKPNVIISLFNEYTEFLNIQNKSFKKYLTLQKYDDEVKNLEHKYGLPFGRLYLACYNNKPAGCIALRKLDNENCEMKRLYVRPEFRGKQIGSGLIQKIIIDAREIGYKHMLLDTLPSLKTAIMMYKKIGFYEISAYNDSPVKETVFMCFDL